MLQFSQSLAITLQCRGPNHSNLDDSTNTKLSKQARSLMSLIGWDVDVGRYTSIGLVVDNGRVDVGYKENFAKNDINSRDFRSVGEYTSPKHQP